MTNGTFALKHKILGGEYILTISNGYYRMFKRNLATRRRTFLKNIHEKTINEHYEITGVLKGEKSLYNIHWIVNGIVRQEIKMNASYPICVDYIKKNKRTYNIGLLKPTKIKNN